MYTESQQSYTRHNKSDIHSRETWESMIRGGGGGGGGRGEDLKLLGRIHILRRQPIVGGGGG